MVLFREHLEAEAMEMANRFGIDHVVISGRRDKQGNLVRVTINDGITHVRTSALLAFRSGSTISHLLGQINEYARLDNTPHSLAMDEYNNNLGVKIVEEVKKQDGDWDDVERKIIEHHKAGQILYDEDDHTHVEEKYSKMFGHEAPLIKDMQNVHQMVLGQNGNKQEPSETIPEPKRKPNSIRSDRKHESRGSQVDYNKLADIFGRNLGLIMGLTPRSDHNLRGFTVNGNVTIATILANQIEAEHPGTWGEKNESSLPKQNEGLIFMPKDELSKKKDPLSVQFKKNRLLSNLVSDLTGKLATPLDDIFMNSKEEYKNSRSLSRLEEREQT